MIGSGCMTNAWRRTEDNDMHYRMRKAGYRFYFFPRYSLLAWRRARRSAVSSIKNGQRLLVGRTMRIQPRCFAPRHLIPALFVLALVVLLAVFPLWELPLCAMLLLYGILDIVFAVKAAAEAPLRQAARFSLPALSLSRCTHRLRCRHHLRSFDREKASEHA